MKNFCLLIFFLFIVNCNKPQSVLICGDHVCINDKEARQFFEKNLSIEVKILNKKRDKFQDLVELNLKENSTDSKEVYLKQKTRTNKRLKVLSKTEVDEIKRDIKIYNKKNNKKISKKKDKTEKNKISSKIKKNKIDDIKKKDISGMKDICKILENCSIEEISKYLIKNSKKKDFPDITLRN